MEQAGLSKKEVGKMLITLANTVDLRIKDIEQNGGLTL